MKWYRLVPVVLMSAFLLGGLLVQPASAALDSEVPGSMLLFPYFDCTSGYDTKIRITNEYVTPQWVNLTFVCEPVPADQVKSTAYCNLFDENFLFTQHQKRVFDVCNELGIFPGGSFTGICPTGRGFVVAFVKARCDASAVPFWDSVSHTCTSVRGGTLQEGEFGPIALNALTGDEQVFINQIPGVVPICAVAPPVPPLSLVPPPAAIPPCVDVEAVNAITVQSLQQPFRFLGVDSANGSLLNLTFGDGVGGPFDYVSLPKVLLGDFAAEGGHLVPGPEFPVPSPMGFPTPDPASAGTPGALGVGGFPDSGIEVQTNFIIFTLDIIGEDFNTRSGVKVDLWNWDEVFHSLSFQFICWEKISSTVLNPFLSASNLGSPYATVHFSSTSVPGKTLLGAIEEVSTVGRTLRTLFHTGSQSTTFTTDVEGP